jgi:CubicO group peptidase (beta-lactamase class C family)
MDELRAWFEERTAANAFRGHAIAWRDGAPIFSFVGGIAHRGLGIPVGGDTRFAVASISKMPTAIAALRLVEQGVLRLDAPLVDVLPVEHQPKALTREHTLYHLLSHTSGLASYLDDDDDTWDSFTANWDRIPTYRLRTPADVLPLFADLPAAAEPGVEVRYNDAAFVLVGLVIEAATSRRWDEVVREAVFEPAGMADTAVEAYDDDPARLAVGYLTDAGPPERWRTNIFSVPAMGMPDGGMITTAEDLARMVDALLAGRLLAAESVSAMTRPQGPPSTEHEQWGYGCQLSVEDGKVVSIGHGGSDPGVAALLAHYLEPGITVAVTCNQDRGAWAATLEIGKAFGISDPRGPERLARISATPPPA